MGRLMKLGLIESLIILTLIGYCYFGGSRLVGKIILTAATILLGGLMALFGQIYQTGADSWQLFAGWALLAFPWVLVGRFAPLWLLWAILVNGWIYLYSTVFPPLWWTFSSIETALWAGFFFNTILLILWEVGAMYFSRLEDRWAVRLVVIASGSVATMLVITAIIPGQIQDRFLQLLPSQRLYFRFSDYCQLFCPSRHPLFTKGNTVLFYEQANSASYLLCWSRHKKISSCYKMKFYDDSNLYQKMARIMLYLTV